MRFKSMLLACGVMARIFATDLDEAVQTRALIGVEQSQAASSERVGRIYVDYALNLKLFPVKWPNKDGSLRFWVNPRLTSIPQQTSFAVQEAGTGATNLIKNLKVNEMVQAIDFTTGLEFPLWQDTDKKTAVQFVLGGGGTTPLDPKEALKVYEATDEALERYGAPGTTSKFNYIALTTPDRERFYFQYLYGFRVKRLYGDDENAERYPMTADITFGQSAAVSGGCLCGSLFRFDVYAPLPKGLEFVTVLFNWQMQFRPGTSGTPLFLKTAGADVTLPRSDLFVKALPQTRDFYRLGAAVDLVEFFKKHIK